jgi:hypothetical protein
VSTTTESKTATVSAEAKARDEALKKSYQSATKRLREKHSEDFNLFRQEEAQKLGVEWTPPKTAEQKAQEEYDALIAKYPHLAKQSEGGPPPVESAGPDAGATRI